MNETIKTHVQDLISDLQAADFGDAAERVSQLLDEDNDLWARTELWQQAYGSLMSQEQEREIKTKNFTDLTWGMTKLKRELQSAAKAAFHANR